jgi:hypothetical protein
MAFGAIDLPHKGVDDFSKILRGLETKLSEAKARRDKILVDLGKARAAVDMGDQRARFTQGSLNKENEAAGRLVLSIEAEVAEARKRLDMAVDQEAGAAAKRASIEAAALPRDKLFETACPDGRRVRHRHHSLEALRNELQPGYRVVAQVFAADSDDKGGLVEPIGQSTMEMLLSVHGDELLAWLAERGIISSDKTVVVLPPNGRELQ